MASREPPASPAFPASPASSDGEHHAGMVSLDVSTIEEIIDYIVSARQRGSQSLIGFHWQTSQLLNLSERLDARLIELDEPKIQRFEYDYESETVYLDIVGDSEFHYQAQAGLRDYIKNRIAELLATTDDPTIRQLIRSVNGRGTFLMDYEGKLHKQADVSFGPSESRQHVERKAAQYIRSSDGKIQAVLILDLQYPSMRKAWVSLLAADDSSGHWDQHSELYHHDDLDQQPVGQVDLYLSDFLGATGLLPALCRPSTAETTAGIRRVPMITLTYESLRAIFRRARYLHDPTEFTTEVGDENENPYEEAERRVTEARREAERRMAEEFDRV